MDLGYLGLTTTPSRVYHDTADILGFTTAPFGGLWRHRRHFRVCHDTADILGFTTAPFRGSDDTADILGFTTAPFRGSDDTADALGFTTATPKNTTHLQQAYSCSEKFRQLTAEAV